MPREHDIEKDKKRNRFKCKDTNNTTWARDKSTIMVGKNMHVTPKKDM